ncbi:MAG: substrate-binding domain-containing protein [Treponemataceae bacterium]|nr:substrate-binding domain-containing protein [Treponemataceae bacterium]
MRTNLKKIGRLALVIAGLSSILALTACNSKKENTASTASSSEAAKSVNEALVKDLAINVLSREEGSGTRGAFIEIFGIQKKDANGKKVDYTSEEAAITNSTAVMMTTVAGDRAAIGYISLGSLNDTVKALKIDGADASVANIQNGSYKISRPFNVAIRDDISEAAKDFLNFILSSSGQNIIEKNKCIPLANPGEYKAANTSGKVVVAGSSSVSPIMEKLIEAFKAVNPNVTIELQTSDSTTGVTNAINGSCDLGMASRGVKDSEKAKGVKEVTIAIDGIAVIVNKDNQLSNLTKEQVEQIFTGKTTKWSEIIK